MKAYCMKCGHPNEYSGAMPKKCEKCSTMFETARVEFRVSMPAKDSGTSLQDIKASIHGQLEESEFDSFMEGAPEAFSENEIRGIFLKDGDNKGINLRDMIAEGQQKGETEAKKKAQPKRAPRRRKK